MTVRLADVGTWRSGGTPPKDRDELWDGGFPWISTRDLKQPELNGSTDTITEDAANRYSTTVPAGSLLIGTRGMALAKRLPAAMVTRAVAFNQDIKAIVPHPEISPKYLLYALLAFEGPILALTDEAAHGTKRLDTDLLRAFRVPCPSLANQQRIADSLDVETARIDAVIRLRTRLRALVFARSRAGLDRALEDTDRGRLKFRLSMRPDYGAAEASTEGHPSWPRFIRITDIDDRGELRDDDVKRLPPETALPFMLDRGDVLVARSGATVGKAFLFSPESTANRASPGT